MEEALGTDAQEGAQWLTQLFNCRTTDSSVFFLIIHLDDDHHHDIIITIAFINAIYY